MSQGKYSPTITREMAARPYTDFIYNADGNVAPERLDGEDYNERFHFGNYNSEGFDSYGYSMRDRNGDYVGLNRQFFDGVDRNGYSENDYLLMDSDDFDSGYF